MKLWFVIRSFGLEGLQAKIRDHVAIAQQFAEWVDAHRDFERVAPAPLNLITFRHRDGDDKGRQILERINATGKVYLTHTRMNDQFVIRMSIGQTNTRLEHVARAWDLICDAARD